MRLLILLHTKKKNTQLKNKMNKILVILPNNLGDVIMTLPVLQGLKTQDCNNEITFFVEEGYEASLINNPACDKIYSFKRKKLKEIITSGNWRDSITLLKEYLLPLVNEQYDRIINLCQHSYVAMFLSLFDKNKILGQHYLREGNYSIQDEWSIYLYAIPFARQFNSLHVIDVYKNIAGVGEIDSDFEIKITENETKNIINRIFDGISDNLKIAILQPGAAYESKQWGIDNFVELAKWLVKDGYQIIITGAESEKEMALGICNKVENNCKPLTGLLSFRETLAIVSLSEICVTGDTAIMHAAAAMKKTVYAIFGPTNPVETGPYSSGNIVFAGKCTQRPCFCHTCKNKLCMKSITPDIVYSFIKGMPKKESSCDIYRTSFDIQGKYKLIPIIENGSTYINENGSMLIRLLFDENFNRSSDLSFIEEFRDVLRSYLKNIEEMEYWLSQFLLKNEPSCITKFEQVRKKLVEDKGITEFLTAILNLKLNSISLLDPISGINESLEVCTQYRKLIHGKAGLYL